jgi:hypothetical protein
LSGRREPGHPLDDALCATAPKSLRLTAHQQRAFACWSPQFGEEPFS